jgi:hypothetical protein
MYFFIFCVFLGAYLRALFGTFWGLSEGFSGNLWARGGYFGIPMGTFQSLFKSTPYNAEILPKDKFYRFSALSKSSPYSFCDLNQG